MKKILFIFLIIIANQTLSSETHSINEDRNGMVYSEPALIQKNAKSKPVLEWKKNSYEGLSEQNKINLMACLAKKLEVFDLMRNLKNDKTFEHITESQEGTTLNALNEEFEELTIPDIISKEDLESLDLDSILQEDQKKLKYALEEEEKICKNLSEQEKTALESLEKIAKENFDYEKVKETEDFQMWFWPTAYGAFIEAIKEITKE